MLERGRTENTHLPKACSYGAITNWVPYRINPLNPPLQGWSASILPVELSYRGLIARLTMFY